MSFSDFCKIIKFGRVRILNVVEVIGYMPEKLSPLKNVIDLKVFILFHMVRYRFGFLT